MLILRVLLVFILVHLFPSVASAEMNARESVLTQHNDERRTGAYLAETGLKWSNVNAQKFGHLYTFPVDGPIVAQPLYAKGLRVGGRTTNVLFVATRMNKLYAFKADDPKAGTIWPPREFPYVPRVSASQPVTAVWRENESDANKHLDLFVAGDDGSVISTFWENDRWHEWFSIRPDAGKTKPGAPQRVTAVWGDPNHPQHLNLFITDRDGTVKSIFCTIQPGRPCWKNEAWFAIGRAGIATPGQPVTAVWNENKTQLDLFVAGKDGKVLSNFWNDAGWHEWFAIRPDTATTKPGTPQQITALWGDPNQAKHLDLFISDRDGTVKSIFCAFQRDKPCWRDEAWLPIGKADLVTSGQPVTAVWNENKTQLDLFVADKDGKVLGNFRNSAGWKDWFAIRPDTATTKSGVPQQIMALWGDPNEANHLNLFMSDKDGMVKSIFCSVRPDRPCWRVPAGQCNRNSEFPDPNCDPNAKGWFAVSDEHFDASNGNSGGPGTNMTPGQEISAVWRDGQHSHLDLFGSGEQITGNYRRFKDGTLQPSIPGQAPVHRPGVILSNYWENGPDWGTWFPVPLRAEALPHMDDGSDPCQQTHGLVGIVSTPVIDPDTDTMFLVYRTGAPLDLQRAHHKDNTKDQPNHYRFDSHHWLVAINLATGQNRHPAVEIEAPNFDPTVQLNRPALLFKKGRVYVAFGAAVCDHGGNPYRGDDSTPHGWVFAYDAKDLSQQAVFTTANDSAEVNKTIIAGIWQSGNGLASDSTGNVYAFTGNNNTENQNDKTDLSESILRLTKDLASPVHIRVPEAKDLDQSGNDGDLAAGGPVLPFDNVLVGGGKQGVLYSILNPANGDWNVSRLKPFQAFHNTWDPSIPPPAGCRNDSPPPPISAYGNQAVGPNIHGSPVVFHPAGINDAFLYAMPEKDYVRVFRVRPTGTIDPCPVKTTMGQADPNSGSDLRSPKGMPGGFLSISANGNRDAIVWASVPCIIKIEDQRTSCDEATNTSGGTNGRLIALNALTLKKLWEDQDTPEPRTLVPFAKFVPPTIAGGKVFRAAYQNAIYVYGLKDAPMDPSVAVRPPKTTPGIKLPNIGRFELPTAPCISPDLAGDLNGLVTIDPRSARILKKFSCH
jgi:hypothetical protein